jgi:hypothetical protein
MQSVGLSDELAMVRARIAVLRSREAALCSELEEGDALLRLGQWTQAEVEERRFRLFDHRLLPLEVQSDPSYWVDRRRREVVCRLRDGARVPPSMRRTEIAAPLAGAADAALIGSAAWLPV